MEAALILPLLLLVVFAALELGRAAGLEQTLTNAAREGARWSALPNASTSSLPAPSTVVARVQSYAAASGLQLPSGDIQVNQAVMQTEDGLATSFSRVDITYTDTLVTPLLSALVPSLALGAHAQMRNETN